MPSAEIAALVVAAFFAGGFVKGAIGLGLPVVVLPVLAVAMSLRDALAIFLLPAIFANLWQATNGPWLGTLVRRMWPFLGAAVLGILAGASVLAGSRSETMALVLGLLLIAYASYALLAPRLPEPGPREVWMSPAAGASAGVLFGMSGLFIIPGILYLETLRMPRDQFVQALGLTFITISLTLALAMARYSLVTVEHVVLAGVGFLPMWAGLWCGTRIRRRISEPQFRKLFFVALIVVGVYLIAKSLWPLS
ncbi:MAG: sulfite exporter TauE/SafE family protein [Pseudomonadota bacterium]